MDTKPCGWCGKIIERKNETPWKWEDRKTCYPKEGERVSDCAKKRGAELRTKAKKTDAVIGIAPATTILTDTERFNRDLATPLQVSYRHDPMFNWIFA